MPIMNCKESVKECGRAIEISEAEREAVLKASAMLDLADAVENATLCAGSQPALRLTQNEWQLIAYALRIAADN